MMNNPKVKYGLYYGIMAIVVSLISYFIGHIFFLGVSRWLVFIIGVYIMYKAAAAVRYREEGFLSFGEGFTAAFIVFVIGNLILTVFTYVLMNYIDASLVDTMNDMPLKIAEKISEISGEEISQKDREEIGNIDLGYGPGIAIWNFLSSLIMPGALIALVIGAVTRREN